jgi:hypothetical protein
MAARVQTTTVDIARRQSLEATFHGACPRCGACPRYLSVHDHSDPCYVPAGDPRDGQFVGDACLHCGTKFPVARELGEIWAREWRTSPLSVSEILTVLGIFLRRLFTKWRSA